MAEPRSVFALRELSLFFEPATDALNDARAFHSFLRKLGIGLSDAQRVQTLYDGVSDIRDAFEAVFSQLVSAAEDGDDIDIAPVVRELALAAIDLVDVLRNDLALDHQFLADMLNYLLDQYLQRRMPLPLALLEGLGVRTTTIIQPGDPEGRNVVFTRRTFDWSALRLFVRDLEEWAAQTYGWGRAQPSFDHQQALTMLLAIIEGMGLTVAYLTPLTSDERQQFIANVPSSEEMDGAWLPFFQDDFNTVEDDVNPRFGAEAGLRVLPYGDMNAPANLGLAIAPYARGAADVSIDLPNQFTFTMAVSSGLTGNQYMTLQPSGVDLVSGAGAPKTTGEFEFGLVRSAEEGERMRLLGSPDAPILSVKSVTLTMTGTLRPSIAVEAKASDILLVFAASSDGFISKVLPSKFEMELDKAGFAWSLEGGFRMIGGNAVSVRIPLHVKIGGIKLTEVLIELDLETGAIVVAADISGKLGPVAFAVDNMGLQARVESVPGTDSGQSGTVGASLSPKPPNGLGLAINTGPISGKGYLEFYPDEHRYAGTFALTIGQYAITIVGLLQTRLPGGEEGFSLLLIITANLPPIQLGFGFVLTGIGGLGGIHRGFKTQLLGDGIREGSADSVLFPENVVENATQIISDLRTFFPPREDFHVFGPMLELGWGTPVLIRMQVGVLMALPELKIALLGKIEIMLPAPQAPLIDINLALLGVLDLPNQFLSIDASLYDSRIVMWSVSGDMAMRLRWGDDARFMLSLGGFHPRYSPPSDFPELQRITATLGAPGGNPRLEYTGYLAVTPNTFQVGAGLTLVAEAGPASVNGGLRFDALFRFNPFEFVVDFSAHLEVHIKSFVLGIGIDGTLSGPSPYHVRGKLRIQVALIKLTVKVNAKIGQAEEGGREMPTADVLAELSEELAKPANWLAQDPGEAGQLVTLRDASDKDGVIAHPLGEIGVRQQIVPLGVTIEKYGNARPRHTRFRLRNFKVGGETVTGDTHLRERFAPAKFREMSDDEKLQSPAFEKLPAGRTLGPPGVRFGGRQNGALIRSATLAYENAVIDAAKQVYRMTRDDVQSGDDWQENLSGEMTDMLERSGAVADAETRHTGHARYRNPGRSMTITVEDENYVVVISETLKHANIADNPADGQTRGEARDALRAHLRKQPDDRDRLQIVGVNEMTA